MSRHKWDYGQSDARNARNRKCKACWATGRRYGPGSTPWSTTLPDGTYRVTIIPPCPGTPWVDRDGFWEIHSGPGSSTLSVSPVLVASLGREKIEEMTKSMGLPPLPGRAWEELAPA